MFVDTRTLSTKEAKSFGLVVVVVVVSGLLAEFIEVHT